MQDIPHTGGVRLGQHSESQITRRFVVVQLVLASSEADECIVVAAQLAHHVAQREYGTEDQLGIVAGSSRGILRLLGCECRGGLIGGESRRGDPEFRIYTLRWGQDRFSIRVQERQGGRDGLCLSKMYSE